MYDILIEKLNGTHLQIHTSESIHTELNEYFAYEPTNASFMRNKRKSWNGIVYLYNYKKGLLPVGLLYYILKFSIDSKYKVKIADNVPKPTTVDEKEYNEWVSSLQLTSNKQDISPYWYQHDIVKHYIANKRAVYLAATSAGKSLSIYMIIRNILKTDSNAKILLLVPGVGLVHQMYNDMKDYSYKNGWDVQNNVHCVHAGIEKDSHLPVIISTWQSIFDLPKQYFDSFTHFICDEVHLAEGKSIQRISKLLVNCNSRVGLTGTLKDAQAHQLTIQGAFGRVKPIVKTHQLQEGGQAAKLRINCIKLQHTHSPDKMEFMDEVDYLSTHTSRNEMLAKFADSITGNTILFFDRRVMGDAIYAYLKANSKKTIFIINGSVDGAVRQQIKEYMNTHDDCIAVCSYGTTSTGWSVNNIHNLIFGVGSKSCIRVLQSVGRGLRLAKNKEYCNLYDFTDKFDSYESYSMQHAAERVRIYITEKFKLNYKNTKL